MTDVEVSVIIPTYNRAHTVLRALDSVFYQKDAPSYEIVIVDDGSTDQTLDIVKLYLNEKLKKFHVEVQLISIPSGGVSVARNTGVLHSKGQWLAFLDSDDEWLEDKLKRQWNFIKIHKELSLVHGDEIWIRQGVRVNPMKKHAKGGGDQFFRSLELCVISPSCVILTRELFDNEGGFDPQMIVCEDYDLWLRITSNRLVGFINEPLIIKYGGHDDQLSHKYKAMDEYRVMSMMKLLKDGRLNPDQLKALVVQAQKKCDILVNGFQKHGHYQKALFFEKLKKEFELN